MLNVEAVHKRASRVLPGVLATSGVLLEDESPQGLAALLFPLRRKSAGSLMFHLSSATRDAMAQEPLRYLVEATQARQGLGRRQTPFGYRAWRGVSIPGALFPCHESSNNAGPRSWQGYFTTKTDDKALLLVIPDARLAVYFWDDRVPCG